MPRFSCPQLFRCLLIPALAMGMTWLHAENAAWTDRETRLANQYLSLLGEQPEYGRVVDLLWNLYEQHDSTALLLKNMEAQAAATGHPAVMLVRAHLVRKSGDAKAAIPLYEKVLDKQPDNPMALRALADVLAETGDGTRSLALRKKLAAQLPDGSVEKARAWIDAGHLALLEQLPDEAASAWEEAAKVRPDDLDLVREVSVLLLRAGKPEAAAGHLKSLISQTDPGERLEALLDLARIHAHADDFDQADAALREALGMLHFRDARYAAAFLRRVRLHEQFGHLPQLRQSLTKAAEAAPPSEQALADAARFFEIIVEPDARIGWLRKLVELSPKDDSYRWELVTALLAHEGPAEAAKLLDERLKGDGTDLPAAVFLRCDAHLREGGLDQAAAALRKLLEKQGGSDEVVKQVLAYARQKALDDIVRGILEERVARRPDDTEVVIELAAFYRARRESAKVDTLLAAYVDGGADEATRAARQNEAADFLASGTDTEAAIAIATEAAERPGAGRAEWVRLSDLLADQGNFEKAATYLEKAWAACTTFEERRDVDERLLSVLMGERDAASEGTPEITSEFRLPAAFTGEGFATQEPATDASAAIPEAVKKHAAAVIQTARQSGARSLEIWRGAWWALSGGEIDTAYELLRRLLIEPPEPSDPALRMEAQGLLLDLAQADDNRALLTRQLRHLMALDPDREIPLTLRLSEQLFLAEQQADSVTGGHTGKTPPGMEAAALLEQALKRHPDSEQLLSALTRIYVSQGRAPEALALWKSAAARAEGAAAVPLLERYSELLLSAQDVPGHIDVQMSLIEREADVKRRREAFRRFLDRLAWPGAEGGALSPTVVEDRLRMVRKALRAKMVRHPFDAFYHEALAGVYQRLGDHVKAFAEMKQAYYTAPETPFSLHQLRDAAERVNDLDSAIYFQKQIAATAPVKDVATESRRLVEMLEQTFRITEADRVRLRLENRFSQDSDALDDLAEYYEASGQDEAELRVLERLVRVRPWDVQARLRLGLKHLALAREADAERELERALDPEHTPAPPSSTAAIATAGRVPLPLIEQRDPTSTNPLSELVWQLDGVQGLTTAEVSDLRGFFSLPRPELEHAPQAANFARLRVIEELAKLKRSAAGAALAKWTAHWTGGKSGPVIERFWALHYAGAGPAARALLTELLAPMKGVEEVFCQVWMRLVTHGMEDLTRWVTQTGVDGTRLDQRQRLLQACVSMLVDIHDFRFSREELTVLGDSRALRNSSLLEITRKLADRGRHEEALALGDTLRRNSASLATDYAFFLSRLAEQAGRWDMARGYIGQVLGGPVSAGSYRGTYDSFLFSLGALDRLAVPAREREANLDRAWERLQQTPASALTSLRRSAIAGMAGMTRPAAGRLESFLMDELLTGRRLGEEPGGLMPQSMSRTEEPLFLRTFWEETREIGSGLTQQGLGDLVGEVNDKLAEKWGSVLLSSQTGSEFHEWRLAHLMSRLGEMSYPERLREIREHLATVDMNDEVSVDVLSELGGRLEASGMPREATAVYQLLPKRAPSNPDYAQWLIRACDSARMIEPGRSFTLQLLMMDPPLKPAQLGDETLRENHARFLAMDFDVAELTRRGFLEDVSVVRIGRIPPEVPYLRELARLQARLGHAEKAHEAWERLHTAMASNVERGLVPDTEACLERARYFDAKQRREAALAALREVELEDPLSDLDRQALILRGKLLAEQKGWEEYTELMTLAVRRQSVDVIVELSRNLAEKERADEAMSFLTQAERTLKQDLDRHHLRAARLKLASHNPGWTPPANRAEISALFRTHTREHDALEKLLAWMSSESKTPRADAWMTVLRSEMKRGGDRAAAAMAACAFPGFPIDEILAAWKKPDARDVICMELAAAHLLQAGRPEDAWLVCRRHRHLAADLDGVDRLWPEMVTIAAARKDQVALKELFSDALRLPFATPENATAWARAFEDAGHPDMAAELFSAWQDRLEARGEPAMAFYEDWAAFLIRQNRLEEAETFLLNRVSMIPSKAPRLLADLYTAWSKTDTLESELPKFHLASGVEKELLFLIRKAPAPPRAEPHR